MNRRERRRLRKLSRKSRGIDKRRAHATESESEVPLATTLQQAITFLHSGFPQEARHLCQQVLATQPDHPEALNLCGVTAFQLGDINEGLELIQAAIAVKHDYVEAHNNLGNVLRALGRSDEAEAVYRRAAEINPNYFDAHYNRGILLESLARLHEAENAYQRAVEINPDFPEASLNLGNVQKALGKLEKAVASYQRVLEINPDHTDGHNNLGSVYHELGKFDEAVTAYRRALDIKPDHVDAQYNLGVSLQELGELGDAAAAYRAAIDINADYVKAHINLGYALQQLGKLDDAVAAYERAIAIDSHNAQVHSNLGDVLLERGEARAAVQVCDGYLKAHPGNTGVLAFKAVALNELGERDSVRFLVDFDRFIRPTQFRTPPGFASLTDFNTALAHHVCTHPTLVPAPTSHATRLGKHSGELLIEQKGPIAVLEALIRRTVEDYRQLLSADLTHPFLENPPQHFGLTAWGVVMETQGHQIPHIHPSAWLSGVYYVQVPEIVRMPGQQHAGWIEFGRPPEHFHCKMDPEVKLIQPKEGLMLLFPSYFYHRTVPFETAERRISISFDVLPLDELPDN
ncbi:MAG: tetratricopeptide repeat protein [Acidiferrobacterales bacterium]